MNEIYGLSHSLLEIVKVFWDIQSHCIASMKLLKDTGGKGKILDYAN